MAKRGQGEGSIAKRPDGTWCARITVGRTPEGKQKRKAFYGKTRKEVQEKMNLAKAEIAKGSYVELTNMTVEQWAEVWMKEYKKHTVKPQTYTNYGKDLKLYILPVIGYIKLKELRPEMIQNLLNSLYQKGYAYSSLAHMKGMIYQMLEQAVDSELIGKNMARKVKIPGTKKKKEIRVLSREEQQRFIEVAKQSYMGEYYIFCLATGMRRGELMVLTWDDIDFEHATVSVNKTEVYVKDYYDENDSWKHMIGSPKTRSSERIIPLLPDIIDMLKRVKEQQEKNKKIQGENYKENNLVFCTKKGQMLSSCSLRKMFLRMMKKANIEEGLHIHCLRHTFATRGLENGIELRVMQDLLGHSSIKMTADLYTHVLSDKKAESIMKIENTIHI